MLNPVEGMLRSGRERPRRMSGPGSESRGLYWEDVSGDNDIVGGGLKGGLERRIPRQNTLFLTFRRWCKSLLAGEQLRKGR